MHQKRFIDKEHNAILTLEELKQGFEELKKSDPATYNYNFSNYIKNCLVCNGGTLEELKQEDFRK